jgi:deazaflavin-dependent oxidoreductase (nitroreductase family)
VRSERRSEEILADASGAVVGGIANAVRRWHDPPMPDFSLFGDEHVRQYEATGGKVGHDWNGTECLILHTIGRKSGETRKLPLIYGRDGEDYLIVASKGGAPQNPGWYENLVAHPDVKIQVRDKVIPVRARTATAQEKARLWPTMTAEWPDYDKYQAGTKRDIPLVVLRPR